MTDLSSEAEVQAILAAVKAKRGYLLPHHGLLALTAPRLARAYDEAYTALTLDRRALSEFEKEFVWLPILIATDEAIATHHIAKFKAAGATVAHVELCLRLAAFARGARDYRFVARHWGALLPGFAHAKAYGDALDALVGDTRLDEARVERGLVEAALAATHACLAQWDELALHIRGAYDANWPETKLAEAISLVMFPGSVPHFVEAARVWRDLVKTGAVPASPALKLWASIDQSGFDGKV